MGRTLITHSARAQVSTLDEDVQEALDTAILNLSEDGGEPVELPTAPEGTEYFAVQPGKNAPVVLYRAVPEHEGGGWLVICLLSPKAYEDLIQLGKFLSSEPGARSVVKMTAAALIPQGQSQDPEDQWLARSVLSPQNPVLSRRKQPEPPISPF